MTDINILTQNVIEREKEKIEQEFIEFQQGIKSNTKAEKESQKQTYVARKFELEKELKRQLDISLNSTNLKKRDHTLEVKQAIIRDYIAGVKRAFEQLDSDSTVRFIQSVVSQFNNNDQLELLLGEKTRQLLGDSLQIEIRVVNEVIPGKAGFILRQGSIEYNYLFDNLVEEKVTALQEIIVKGLFQKQ